MYYRSYEGYEDDGEDADEDADEDEDDEDKDESKDPCVAINKRFKNADYGYTLIADKKKNVKKYLKSYIGGAYAANYKSAIDNKCITKLSDEKIALINKNIEEMIKKKKKKKRTFGI